jgi:hypothetical protein
MCCFGSMPLSRVLLLLTSCSQEVMGFVLLVVLLRWESKAAVRVCQRSRSNKLVGYPQDLYLMVWCCVGEVEAPIWSLFFSHQLIKGMERGSGGQKLYFLRHGVELLIFTEFINWGEDTSPLSLVVGTAPCCGAISTAASSTSWPVCLRGGHIATPSRRSTQAHRQVV